MIKTELKLTWIVGLTLIAIMVAWALPSLGQTDRSMDEPMKIEEINTCISLAQDAINNGDRSEAARHLAMAAMMLDPEVAMKETCPMLSGTEGSGTGMGTGTVNCPLAQSEGSACGLMRPAQNTGMDEYEMNTRGYSGIYCPSVLEEEEARCFIDWLAGSCGKETTELENMIEQARYMRQNGDFMAADRTMAEVNRMGWQMVDENQEFSFTCPVGDSFMATANRARNHAMDYQNQGADVADIYELIGMAETARAQERWADAWDYMTQAQDMLMDLSEDYDLQTNYETGSGYQQN